MILVVPMAGFGERFRRAGYTVPKPLIEVHGRAMAAHVVDLFPDAERVVLVCNQAHLDDPTFRMREVLAEQVPHAEILAVPPHRRGPVHTLVQVLDRLDPDAALALAMCDLHFPWDPAHFAAWVRHAEADGCVLTYRGFHPHLLHSVHYAFLREEGGWATAIQEKQAYTDDPIGQAEPCSNGVYWFRTVALAARYLRRVHGDPDVAIAGEHYVSQAYQPMIEDGLAVAVYDVEHYLQWGNPRDLEEYRFHARGFAARAANAAPVAVGEGALVVPMAGLGQRFADRGYDVPKPLLEVCGRPMAVAAALDLPRRRDTVFVLRHDMPGLADVRAALTEAFPGSTHVVLDGPTDGQARTALLGVLEGGVDPEASVVLGTCDNGLVYDREAHDRLLVEADVLVWGFRGHPAARLHPRQYGWIDADADGRVRGISVKQPLDDPSTDPIVVGAFSFRRAADLQRACERLFARDGRVRGEFYLDAAVSDALALGLDVRVFAVDHYEGWGTPDEWLTWQYWQRYFANAETHPYTISQDTRVVAPAAFEVRLQPSRPVLLHPKTR